MIELDAPVLALTLGVAVVTALIFGMLPALQWSRRDLDDRSATAAREWVEDPGAAAA